jgi:hypothetical protein
MRTRHRFLIPTGVMLGFLAWASPAGAKGPLPFELVISGRDQDREIRILPHEFGREVSGASGYLYGVLDPAAAPTPRPTAAYQVDFYLYVREELTIHGWVARTVYQGPGPDRQRQLFIRLTYYLATDRSPAIARVEKSVLPPPFPSEWVKPTPELERLIGRSITLGRWVPKPAADVSYAREWWPIVGLALACTILLTAWARRREFSGRSAAVATLAVGVSIAEGGIAVSLAAAAGVTMNTEIFGVAVAILLPIAGVLLLLINLLVINAALQWAQRHRSLPVISPQ